MTFPKLIDSENKEKLVERSWCSIRACGADGTHSKYRQQIIQPYYEGD